MYMCYAAAVVFALSTGLWYCTMHRVGVGIRPETLAYQLLVVCFCGLGRHVVPAGMYAGQVWGTEYIKVGKEFASDLQVRHM
eukprot:132923-Pelagomonas_calceolata.AAC.1